jgi:putative tricarboxylic transport membrane protein
VKFNDAIFGVLLMVLGGVVLTIIQGFPSIPGQKFGPALFPGLIATGLLVCGVMLTLQGLRQRQAWVQVGEWVRQPRRLLSLAILLGGISLYIEVSEQVGFLPLSVLTVSALMMSLQVRPSRAVLLAIALSLMIHTLFYQLLRVPLPWGWLMPVSW